MGRGTSDILCHPGDIFRHHQNPDLPRRVGLRTTAKESPGSTAAFRLWPPPVAQPYRRTLPGRIRKRMASACDQHIFADARSASLRKLGLWLVSELSPLGKMGLGWRPSEGRALHDRQETPCPTVAFPLLATGSCSTASHVRAPYDRNSRPYGFHRRSSFGQLPLLDPLRMMLLVENQFPRPRQSHSTPCKKKIAPSIQTPIPAR
jgi:hypothetical protein